MSTEYRAMYEQGLAAMEAAAPWPDGVIARHLTWAGAFLRDLDLTVDLSEKDGRYASVCRRGCGDILTGFNKREVSDWAASHAAACRALPRPGVA